MPCRRAFPSSYRHRLILNHSDRLRLLLLHSCVLAAICLQALPVSGRPPDYVSPHPDLLERWGGRLPGWLGGEQTPHEMYLQSRAARKAGGFKVLAGTGTTLTILWDWIDHQANRTTHPATAYEELLYSTGTYATGSMNDFYLENSSGLYGIAGDVIDWGRAPRSYAGYVDQFGSATRASGVMLVDAIGQLDAVVDFSRYDNDGPDGVPASGDDDGLVDALFFIHAGPGQEFTGDPADIWSHAGFIEPPLLTDDGVGIDRYSVQPEEHPTGELIDIGVLCHEYGHVIGLPDLYDNDLSSGGIGEWGLMGAGSWNHREGDPAGTCPAHMSAWCKKELGWVTVEQIVTTTLAVLVQPAEVVPRAYQIFRPGAIDGPEYFLCENRRQLGFDEGLVRRQIRLGLPAPEGLIIYHVDESVTTNVMDHRRLVDVEEASPWYTGPDSYVETLDGWRRVATYANLSQPNRGDDGDLWPGFTAFSADSTTWLEPRDRTRFGPETHPSSQDNDCLDTGVAIEIADTSGDDIYVDFLLDDPVRSLAGPKAATLRWDFETGLHELPICGHSPLWDTTQSVTCPGGGGLWFGQFIESSPCEGGMGYGNGWAGFASKRLLVNALAEPVVIVTHKYDLEPDLDHAYVEFRCVGDAGQPWYPLATFTGNTNCVVDHLSLPPGLLGSCADLDGLAMIHLRFRFASNWYGSTEDGGYCGTGWWIDDVQVIDATLGVGDADPDSGTVEGELLETELIYLDGAAPNPFNPITSLRFYLSDGAGNARLEIFDQRGSLIRTLWSGAARRGWIESVWDGRDNSSDRVASGIYFARLQAGGNIRIQKLAFVK